MTTTIRNGWLDAKAAAHYCSCSVKIIWRAAAAGQLKAVRLSGNLRFRFKASWLDDWMLHGGDPDSCSGESRPTTDGKSTDSGGKSVESQPALVGAAAAGKRL